MHELKALCDTLHFAGTFDQLNIGGCVALEIVARRIQTIADAYSSVGKPNWSSPKFFSGMSGVDDAVAPSLRLLAEKRQRETRGPSNCTVWPEGAIEDAVETGGLPGAKPDAKKGKGKGRGAG